MLPLRLPFLSASNLASSTSTQSSCLDADGVGVLCDDVQYAECRDSDHHRPLGDPELI